MSFPCPKKNLYRYENWPLNTKNDKSMKFYHGFQSCVDSYQKELCGSNLVQRCLFSYWIWWSEKKKFKVADKFACDVIKRVNFWIFESPVTEMGYKPSWCRNENETSTSYKKHEQHKTTKIKPACIKKYK